MKKISLKLEENILTTLSLIMIFGSLIYYFYQLNWLGVLLTLLLSLIILFFKLKIDYQKNETAEITTPTGPPKSLNSLWPVIIYLLLIATNFFILLQSASNKALISPWSVVPSSFFWLYGLTSAWLFFTLNKRLNSTYKLYLLRIHYFLALSVALVVYKIGYGFDPFIHQATMELIDKNGYVDPKPLYYLGQYSLIVVLHKISGLSIYLLNKILIPLLAALFLPKAILAFTEKYGSERRAPILALTLLALPFNIFILSTPQNLTYLWLLLLIFYSLTSRGLIFLITLAVATLSIHPLGGIPAILFLIWLTVLRFKNKIKNIWWRVANIFLWISSAVSLPLSFTLVTGQTWTDLSLSLTKIKDLFNINHNQTNIGDVFLNFPYLLNNNWLIIFIFLILLGFSFWFKKNQDESRLLIKISSALFVGYLLSASLSFSFLIDYERDAYISRLPVLMSLYLIPALILSIDFLIARIWQQSKFVKISALITISALTVSSLYLSYPRLDAYANSRGYSVSEADLLAVNSIQKQTDKPYIVLANQQTSVASLKELGFDHYFTVNGEPVFFYPIPTGGKLYQYYLKMVNDSPTKETMEQAMSFVGVQESYFVINKYWWLSNRIIAEAKINADAYWKINDGEIYIFKFNN